MRISKLGDELPRNRAEHKFPALPLSLIEGVVFGPLYIYYIPHPSYGCENYNEIVVGAHVRVEFASYKYIGTVHSLCIVVRMPCNGQADLSATTRSWLCAEMSRCVQLQFEKINTLNCALLFPIELQLAHWINAKRLDWRVAHAQVAHIMHTFQGHPHTGIDFCLHFVAYCCPHV